MNQDPNLLRSITEVEPPELFGRLVLRERLQSQGFWKHSLGVDCNLAATSAVSEHARRRALWNGGFALMLQAEAGAVSKANAVRYRDGCLMALMSVQDSPLNEVAGMEVLRHSRFGVVKAVPWTEEPICELNRSNRALSDLAEKRMTRALDRYAIAWRRVLETEREKSLWLTMEGKPLSADRIHSIVLSHLENFLRRDSDEVSRESSAPDGKEPV